MYFLIFNAVVWIAWVNCDVFKVKYSAIKKNNLITTFSEVPRKWILSFDVTLNSKSLQKTNLVHFATGSCCESGLPSVYVRSRSTRLKICRNLRDDRACYDTPVLGLKKKATVTIEQILVMGLFQFTIIVNDGIIDSFSVKMPPKSTNVNLYLSSKSDIPADAVLENLSFERIGVLSSTTTSTTTSGQDITKNTDDFDKTQIPLVFPEGPTESSPQITTSGQAGNGQNINLIIIVLAVVTAFMIIIIIILYLKRGRLPCVGKPASYPYIDSSQFKKENQESIPSRRGGNNYISVSLPSPPPQVTRDLNVQLQLSKIGNDETMVTNSTIGSEADGMYLALDGHGNSNYEPAYITQSTQESMYDPAYIQHSNIQPTYIELSTVQNTYEGLEEYQKEIYEKI